MSVQATDRDEKHRNARAADKATAKKPSFFKMRAQMLDQGRTNTPLARTDGGHTDVGKHEGIMLPAGAYYWFEATSKEPLVLVRVGCRVGPQDASGRLNIRGEPMPGDSKENKRVPVVVRNGEFFE